MDKEIEDLGEETLRDYGPDKAFWALRDKCMTAKFGDYEYEMCWFKDAIQTGDYATQLGSWKRWENDYHTMIYEDGEECWNGPARSFHVTLECGEEEKLLQVTEPNRCEYHAKVSTAAICKPNKVHDEL